jgi:hypothetical protein
VSQVVIENPIINSPFDEPTRHFRFNEEGITDEEVAGRSTSLKKLSETNAVIKLLKLCLITLSLVLTTNSQGDNETAAGLPGSTSVTSKITSNEWKIDALVVHGTLTNTNLSSVSLTTPALLGYDANK